MKAKLLLTAGLIVAATLPARAQELAPQCRDASTPLQDSCQKGVDIFNFVMPQFSAVIAGGSASPGQVGTLGGFGDLSVDLRASVLQGVLPDVGAVPPSPFGANRSDYPVNDQIFGFATAMAGIGVFDGIPVGLTKIGGIDVLIGASYVPALQQGDMEIMTPNGPLQIGYGARLGLVQERGPLPSLSVTYLARNLPTLDIVNTSFQDTIAIRNFNTGTDLVRLTVGKEVGSFDLAAGVGGDVYNSTADLEIFMHQVGPAGQEHETGTMVGFDQKMTRRNYFIDAAWDLPLVTVAGEVGHVTGGEVSTYNTFSEHEADDPYLYGSLSLRMTF